MAVSSKGRSRKSTSRGRSKKKGAQQKDTLRGEITLVLVITASILLFVSNFGLGGMIGNGLSSFLFGLFGLMSYIFPVVFVFITAFIVSNKQNSIAAVKGTAGAVFFLCTCVLCELFNGGYEGVKKLTDYYTYSATHKKGGGFVSGLFCSLFYPGFGEVGTYILLAAFMVICFVLITEKSLLQGMRSGSRKVAESATEAKKRQEERRELRRRQLEEEAAQRVSDEGPQPPRRRDKKVRGVAFDTQLPREEIYTEEVREIAPRPRPSEIPIQNGSVVPEPLSEELALEEAYDPFIPLDSPAAASASSLPLSDIDLEIQNQIQGAVPEIFGAGQEKPSFEADLAEDGPEAESWTSEDLPDTLLPEGSAGGMDDSDQMDETVQGQPAAGDFTEDLKQTLQREKPGSGGAAVPQVERKKPLPKPKPYKLPPLKLLAKGNGGKNSESDAHLRETALKLQQTLHNFGVNVTITNISCGPTITRYELMPEMGVKVNRIVNLADDIKLNLAATDIRIEAPIPGKAAVGIEVPNAKNSTVMFRDLIESEEYRNHESNLAFAAGKDIAGQVIITDIAKMPHLLIAGATGSGKSVCINTLIMSILYKAKPDEVKLIMIDPKVVELSVYNGIPHLFIPVVTDPKKAAGALNWAVAEMTDRYQKFADYNVRDLAGYNKKVESIADIDDEEKPQKLPQLVIIVDELADLMMVSAKEVEDAICRLAQLARAAGIHLILATQRPSVNVITGLIKANMPSKIAFSVSSGVDSRTIIGMNGAEKLLGKGDMLFYPQGYPKPVRAQGAFISDKEVMQVVEFLSKQNAESGYDTAVEEKIISAQSAAAAGDSGGGDGPERDAYFVDAGRFIIEKDKASIGMLQRMFKIGFNRAARIMDQLADAGVVGEEEGTKPRKVLMSMEEFDAYIDEYV